MPPAFTIEVPDALAEAWRKLPPERRSSVVDYAGFLAAQEESCRFHEVDEIVEAEWSEMLDDPQRTANFARWAADAARGEAQPIDLSKL
jgi:acyl-CoA reductase-like NAD-dependent aldehyde dehydrogenase